MEQSPLESMKCAIDPLFNALVCKEVLRHPNLDVNVLVACCLSGIMRIKADRAPSLQELKNEGT